jgi:hypothetical protein
MTRTPRTEGDAESRMMHGILKKLGITIHEMEAMYSRGPVNGFTGLHVAGQLAERFGLDEGPGASPQGKQLAEQGALTWAEGRWLDEVPYLLRTSIHHEGIPYSVYCPSAGAAGDYILADALDNIIASREDEANWVTPSEQRGDIEAIEHVLAVAVAVADARSGEPCAAIGGEARLAAQAFGWSCPPE